MPGRDRLGTRRQAHSPHTARPWGHSLGRTPSPAALPAGTCSFQHPWDTDTMGLRTQPPSNTYGATQAQNQGLRTPQPRHWPGLGLTAKGRSSLHPPASGLRVLAARDRRVCWSGGDQGRPPGGSQRKVCGSEGRAGGLAAASAPGAPWWPRGEWLDTSQRGAGRAPGCRFQRVQSVGLAVLGGLSCSPSATVRQTGRGS